MRCGLQFAEREATKYYRVFFRAQRAMNVHHQPDSGTFDLRAVARQAMIETFFTLQVRVADILGDNGMISVVICRPAGNEAWY